MSLVIDASMTLAWCFEDERTQHAEQTMRRVGEAGAWVPTIWKLEVGNALRFAVRRKRITAQQMTAALSFLDRSGISIDAETAAQAWTTALLLAERHDLTLYDAAYLELALRRVLPLASLDRALCEAALQAGAALC